MYPQTLQNAVTNVRNFESVELEANHAQAINLVMNESSDLNSKLKQLTNSTCYLSSAAPTHLLATASGNLLAPTNSNTTTELTLKWNLKAKTDTAKLEIINGGPSTNLQFHSTVTSTGNPQNQNAQHYLSLLVISKDTSPNNWKSNQHKPLISNIPPATITNNKLLDAIFSFEFEETTPVLLFSRAILDTKPIITMYTDAKIDSHVIKLILDSRSAGSIITKQLMDQLSHQIDHAASAKIITADEATKTPIGKIYDFPIEVNGIIVLIKVLVMKATQYQVLIGNNWLFKVNATLD
ncbi:hypothetical protein G9A89_012532 [Geosiphon pyriformis]|nr:hypothetical protein G9A89_012532 [Geosiphon pyriformis]